MGRKILVAVDASKAAQHAFLWAAKYLCQPGDEVTCVHAYDKSLASDTYAAEELDYPTGIIGMSKELYDMRLKQMEEGGKILLERFEALAKDVLPKDVTLFTLLVPCERGLSEKEQLCAVAEKNAYDMLVLSSRGFGAVKRALLGSTSDYCAHHCTSCSVIIVREEVPL